MNESMLELIGNLHLYLIDQIKEILTTVSQNEQSSERDLRHR